MNMITKHKNLRLITAFLLLLATMPTLAQQQTVRGIVRDSMTNEPIAGAAVKVVGTQLGTSTDAEGRFLVANVLDGATLEISFIDRKSTRLTSSHVKISYAVFCLKK